VHSHAIVHAIKGSQQPADLEVIIQHQLTEHPSAVFAAAPGDQCLPQQLLPPLSTDKIKS
jgi:hypothetical protein